MQNSDLFMQKPGFKGYGYTFIVGVVGLGETALSKSFCLPSEKGSTLKGKNLLPMGVNSFLLE